MFFFFDRKNFPSLSKLIFLFVPFFLVAAFLIIRSDNWLSSLQKYLSYMLMLFIIPNYFLKIYQENGNKIVKDIVFLFSLVLLAGLVSKYLFPDLATMGGRFRGIFGNPNGVGVFCTLFFLLFSVINEYFPNLFSRAESIFVYAVILVSVIFCSSRNAIMCILIYLLFTRLYRVSPFIGFLILCIIIVGYEFVLQNFESIIRSAGLGEYFRIKTLETGSGRNIAWTFAWENIQSNFFFGKGFGFDELLYRRYEHELSVLGHQGNAHNSYLTLWLNTGAIGLFLFLRGFLLAFIKGAKSSRIVFPVMFAVIFSANNESWLAGSLNPITFQLWIILTIITSSEIILAKEKESRPLVIADSPE